MKPRWHGAWYFAAVLPGLAFTLLAAVVFFNEWFVVGVAADPKVYLLFASR